MKPVIILSLVLTLLAEDGDKVLLNTSEEAEATYTQNTAVAFLALLGQILAVVYGRVFRASFYENNSPPVRVAKCIVEAKMHFGKVTVCGKASSTISGADMDEIYAVAYRAITRTVHNGIKAQHRLKKQRQPNSEVS